jgi:hypothetical protein
MAQRHQRDAGREPNTSGLARPGGEDDRRMGHGAAVIIEVVLRDDDARPAEAIGEHNRFGQFAIEGVQAGGEAGTVGRQMEQRKVHDRTRLGVVVV